MDFVTVEDSVVEVDVMRRLFDASDAPLRCGAEAEVEVVSEVRLLRMLSRDEEALGIADEGAEEEVDEVGPSVRDSSMCANLRFLASRA